MYSRGNAAYLKRSIERRKLLFPLNITYCLPAFPTAPTNSFIAKSMLESDSAPALFRFDISVVFAVVISVGVVLGDIAIELCPSPHNRDTTSRSTVSSLQNQLLHRHHEDARSRAFEYQSQASNSDVLSVQNFHARFQGPQDFVHAPRLCYEQCQMVAICRPRLHVPCPSLCITFLPTNRSILPLSQGAEDNLPWCVLKPHKCRLCR